MRSQFHRTHVSTRNQRGKKTEISGRGKVIMLQRPEEKWEWGEGSSDEAKENRLVGTWRIEIKGELKTKSSLEEASAASNEEQFEGDGWLHAWG